MVKRKSFAVWILKDVANTLSEIKGEVLPSVQDSGILSKQPTTSVQDQNNPGYVKTVPQPVQPPNKLITGTRVQNWRDRLKQRQILPKSQPIEKHQKVSTPPKTLPQTDDQKWYRCTECRKNYQGELSYCPDCNTRIPDWIYTKRTGEKTDISLG